MLTQTDVKNLLKYFSDTYIICQFNNGESLFTELLLKSDVYVDVDLNIHNPPSETKFEVDIPDFVKEFRESTMEYINNERSKKKKCPYKKK